jgi:hypothetical protein
MSNLVPSGIDAITGQSKPLTSSDTLSDGSGKTLGLPKRYVEGLVLEHVQGESARKATVTPGSCRNAADTADIELTTKTTVDADISHSASTGLPLINGIDEIGLDNLATGSITCSQTTTTITASGNIIPHYKPKDITGTISATGTALTGTSTKFLSELYPGDLVGSSTTYGFSYVVSVESDTAATLWLAFPGGDPTSIAAQVINQATIWPGTVTTNKQVVRTINAAGTSIVVYVSATVAASSPLTIGVFPDDNTPDNLSYYNWMYVYLIDDGTTPGLLVSTQYQEPLSLPAGYTSYRRVGSLNWYDPEDDTGQFLQAQYVDGPAQSRFCAYSGGNVFSLTAGTAEDWYPGSPDFGEIATRGQFPRTARKVSFLVHATNQSTSNDLSVFVTSRYGGNGSSGFVTTVPRKDDAGDQHRTRQVWYELTVDEGGGFKTQMVLAAGLGSVQFQRKGFYDIL